MTAAGYVPVSSEAELRDLLGEPSARAVSKERPRLHQRDREWLAASPFCLIATADADGNCDVSPKGDPPGFPHVIDDTTIAIPERPGNRRAGSCQPQGRADPRRLGRHGPAADGKRRRGSR